MSNHSGAFLDGEQTIQIIVEKVGKLTNDVNLGQLNISRLTKALDQTFHEQLRLAKQMRSKVVFENFACRGQYQRIDSHLCDHGQHATELQGSREGQNETDRRCFRVVRVVRGRLQCLQEDAQCARRILVPQWLGFLHLAFGQPLDRGFVRDPTTVLGTAHNPTPDRVAIAQREDLGGVHRAVVILR